jgi:hypothetical protein
MMPELGPSVEVIEEGRHEHGEVIENDPSGSLFFVLFLTGCEINVLGGIWSVFLPEEVYWRWHKGGALSLETENHQKNGTATKTKTKDGGCGQRRRAGGRHK